jgi:hypothetical protein
MKPTSFILLASVLAANLLPSPSRPATQQPQTADSASTERFFNGPERRAIPWHVEVWSPILTYQQRYLVIVSGSVDVDDLRKRAIDNFTLHIKVQDASGNWFPGEDTSEYQVPASNPPRTYAQFYSAVYALPGEYRVSIVLFDKSQRQVNVEHTNIRVPEVKGNSLPDLTRGLPAIEFPSRIPGMDKNQSGVKDRGWSLAQPVQDLPITTGRPLRIDLLLDFSDPDALELPFYLTPAERGLMAQFTYYSNARIMIQMGSVLAHLKPTDGCMRVSAADMTNMSVLLDRQDASKLNWKSLEDSLFQSDLSRVDFATLSKRPGRSLFTDRFLTDLANDASPCEGASNSPDHVVVIVSHHLRYPPHTPVAPIQPQDCPHCRFVYLRWSYNLDEHQDRYRDMIKLLQPRSLSFSTPQEFRKTLGELAAELSDSKVAAGQPTAGAP